MDLGCDKNPQTVECCLLDKLPGILFTPDMTNEIPDHDMTMLAAEGTETCSQRQKLLQQLQILECSIHELELPGSFANKNDM